MIRLIVLTAMLSSFAGIAAAQQSDSAHKVCNTIPFAQEKVKCLSVVKDRYFEDTAVDVCATIPFAADKIDCLKMIADKSFNLIALDVCKTIPFANDKINCLQNAGSPVVGCIELDEVEYELYKAVKGLRRGKYRQVQFELQELLDRVKRCTDR